MGGDPRHVNEGQGGNGQALRDPIKERKAKKKKKKKEKKAKKMESKKRKRTEEGVERVDETAPPKSSFSNELPPASKDPLGADSEIRSEERRKEVGKLPGNGKRITSVQNLASPQQRDQQHQPPPRATTKAAPSSTATAPLGSHPFEVDDSDHCETPLRAYQDLAVLLDRLLFEPSSDSNNARSSKRHRSSLKIYDPYYCDGGVKTKLASLGFTNVINENRDFYADIANRQIPDYDVLVTNPPYSGSHMEKLLDFCVRQGQAQAKANSKSNSRVKPSFLLLPHFVYTKDYYARVLAKANASSSQQQQLFCFLVPSVRYSYVPPAWVTDRRGASKALARGKDTTAPFPSFWYCGHLRTTTTLQHEWLEQTFGRSGSLQSKHVASGLRYAQTPLVIPREFKGEFDPTKKRPNPRARKRMRKAAALAVANGGQQQPQQPQPNLQKKRQRQRDPQTKKKRRY